MGSRRKEKRKRRRQNEYPLGIVHILSFSSAVLGVIYKDNFNVHNYHKR